MKRIIFLLSVALMLGIGASAQNKIRIPSQNNNNGGKTPSKITTPSQNNNTGGKRNNNSNSGRTQSRTPVETPAPSAPSKPSRDFSTNEYINGFNVTWASEVTNPQHKVIKRIIENMVYVPGGTFSMGSEEYGNTKPIYSTSVSSFHIGKYELTQNEWDVVMGGSRKHANGNQMGGDYPVEQVTYYDCLNFIKKLNRLTGLSFRIPTEAEWEFAARGGNNSKNYRFSGSNSASSVGWTRSNSGQQTHPVGKLSPNELGLYDMTGNVNEWVCEKYSFTYNRSRDSEQYVVRGGNFYWTDEKCTNAYRYSNFPDDAWGDTGLRLAH